MSAFAVIYDRSGGLLEPGLLGRVMERLSHRGPDGQDTFTSGPLAIGHWHFWTTPEEVGERQPLKMDGLPFTLVFDGRLDNREDLFAALSISVAEGRSLSDAVLVLRAYAAWGEGCVERFIGEFALVLFDEYQHRLFCARDHLGDRTLFYAQHGSRVLIASEPWAVLGAQSGPVELDERAVAHYFALRATPDGQTLFKDVIELLPAHAILINEHELRLQRYWQPDLTRKVRYKNDQEYAEHFLDLLNESVRCRMRATTPVGVQMSGGLDSASVACLAARQIAPRQLTTISYVFDELVDCDEREYIDSVVEKWNIRSLRFLADDAWPFRRENNWHKNLNMPDVMGYRPLFDRVYHATQQNGIRVLLTGMYGDHHYSAGVDWFVDLLLDGKIKDALAKLFFISRSRGVAYILSAPFLRRTLARFIKNFSVIYDALRTEPKPPVWLSTFAASNINFKRNRNEHHPHLSQTGLMSLWVAMRSSTEHAFSTRYCVEIRSPYRDRRLAEFTLGLPAYQLYNNGAYKHILRAAMNNILPERIRARLVPTRLLSLYSRGLEMESCYIDSVFKHSTQALSSYIDLEWVKQQMGTVLSATNDGPHAVVPSLCIAYHDWRMTFFDNDLEAQCEKNIAV